MDDKRTRVQRVLLTGAGILFVIFCFPWHQSRLEFGARHDSFSLGIPSSPWYRTDTYESLDGQPLRLDVLLPDAPPEQTAPIQYDPDAPNLIESPTTAVEIDHIGLFNWSSLSLVACIALLIASAILRRRATGVDVEEAGVKRSTTSFRAFSIVALLAVIVVPTGWMAYGWATRMALLHTMLHADSYSLKQDPATVSRVKAIVPELLKSHRQAVADCGTATMADLSRMDAFNRRVRSWRAILMAMDVTADAGSRDYVEAFVNSARALPEEVTSGNNALE